jgi:transposase-like protein
MAQDEGRSGEVKYLADKQKDRYLKPPRQKHSHEKKLQVVSEALTPGASISAVARRHGINTNLVFSWIRMYENGCLLSPSRRDLEREMQKFVVAGLLPKPQEPGERQHLPEGGMIEIENGSGVKVRLTGSVDGKTLALVMAELRKLPS